MLERLLPQPRLTRYNVAMDRPNRIIPWLITLCVFAALVILNADGYRTRLFSPWPNSPFSLQTPLGEGWSHGWPIEAAVRQEFNWPSTPVFTGYRSTDLTSRWPIDNAPVQAFHKGAAIVDALFAVALTIGTYFGAKRLPQWPLRFSIRTMLLCLVIVGVVLAFRDSLSVSRYGIQFLACAVVLIGLVLNVVGGASWLRLQKLRSRFSEK